MPTRTHVWRLAVVVLAMLVVAPVGAISQDFDAVRQQKDALESDIDQTTAELESLRARVAQTRDELTQLRDRTRQLEEQAGEAREALQDRARTSFMGGDNSMSELESLLSSDGPTAALERGRILAALSRRDISALEQTSALRIQIEQNRALLTAKAEELEEMEAELEEHSAVLQDRFEDVSALYRDLKERKDRQRTISRGTQSGTYACIFQGAHHFRDTWGAPRSGGRAHKGTDVMAPYGAEVYAFTNGRISRMSNSGLGGMGLYLRGDDGVEYYYAHLSGYADRAYAGKRVEAGELVAYNGSSGNADRWAPHVHFEVHPGGGGAVNPYPWLTAAC